MWIPSYWKDPRASWGKHTVWMKLIAGGPAIDASTHNVQVYIKVSVSQIVPTCSLYFYTVYLLGKYVFGMMIGYQLDSSTEGFQGTDRNPSSCSRHCETLTWNCAEVCISIILSMWKVLILLVIMLICYLVPAAKF